MAPLSPLCNHWRGMNDSWSRLPRVPLFGSHFPHACPGLTHLTGATKLSSLLRCLLCAEVFPVFGALGADSAGAAGEVSKSRESQSPGISDLWVWFQRSIIPLIGFYGITAIFLLKERVYIFGINY